MRETVLKAPYLLSSYGVRLLKWSFVVFHVEQYLKRPKKVAIPNLCKRIEGLFDKFRELDCLKTENEELAEQFVFF